MEFRLLQGRASDHRQEDREPCLARTGSPDRPYALPGLPGPGWCKARQLAHSYSRSRGPRSTAFGSV